MFESGQFTIYATFQAKSGEYDQLKRVNQQYFDMTKETPGLVQMFFFEPPATDKPFLFVSIWQSKADFQNFMKSEQMQEYHSSRAIKELHATAMESATADFYSVMDEWHMTHSSEQIA